MNLSRMSGSSNNVRRDTSSLFHNYDDFSIPLVAYGYKSNITPRTTTISRRSTGLNSSRANIQHMFSSSNIFGHSNIPIKPKNAAVIALNENREKEKRELTQLNDKFASYVERVRFLEVHNKKLQLELEALKNRVGSESNKIKEMYEVELKEAKVLIDETNREKANAELKARHSQEDTEKFNKRYSDIMNSRSLDKARIDELNIQIAENEAELNLLRRRLGDLEDEAKRYKIETQRIIAEIQRITSEIDAETLQRVQLENEKNGLEEELGFLRQMHSQELEDLRQKSFLDVGLDSSQFFKSELANAIREIRSEYEQMNSHQRADLEQWYRMKIQEVQTRCRPEAADNLIAREESKKLRNAVSDQRREIANMKARNAEIEARIKEAEEILSGEQRDGQLSIKERDAEIADLRRRQAELLANYDELTKRKTSLEEEIITYRRLLEGDSGKEGLKQVVEGIEERARNLTSQQALKNTDAINYSFSISSTSGTGRNSIDTFSRNFKRLSAPNDSLLKFRNLSETRKY